MDILLTNQRLSGDFHSQEIPCGNHRRSVYHHNSPWEGRAVCDRTAVHRWSPGEQILPKLQDTRTFTHESPWWPSDLSITNTHIRTFCNPPPSVLLTIRNSWTNPWNSWNQRAVDFNYPWTFIDGRVARCLASYPLNAPCMHVPCFFLLWTQRPTFPAFPGNARKPPTLGAGLMSQVLWHTAHACQPALHQSYEQESLYLHSDWVDLFCQSSPEASKSSELS